MLIKLLSKVDQKHLLELAKLLAVSDKPLLWDGKTSDEVTASTDLSALSIQEGAQELELIADLERSAGLAPSDDFFGAAMSKSAFFGSVDVRERLIKALKAYPIMQVEKPEIRVQAATTVLKELLKDKQFELPTAPKVILFELLLVALRDGHISSIELALLKEYQLHHQLDDFIFDDLLERAEALNQEVSRTIAIILE
jgi:hypothetical protein